MGSNEFVVVDFSNSKIVKQGQFEEGLEETKQILAGLPNGHYVVYLNGTNKQYVKSD